MPSYSRRIPWIVAAFVATACVKEPVDWQPERSVSATAAEPSITVDGRIIADTLVALASHLQPPGGGCPASLRIALGGRTLHGAWWIARPDSSVRLMASRSSDGGVTWTAPVAVDTTDRGVTGCRHEPPAIAADTVSGYVHVTYGLVAAEGPGLFFSHSMDGGAMFHAPVPILYGERLGRTSVSADGDVVAVAFEDPNSRSPRVGLALSRTMGHIFEHRLTPLSSDNGAAAWPLVKVRGRTITAAWRDEGATPATSFHVLTGTLH